MSQTTCDVHGQPWKIVPKGVSKTTGKSYEAFTVCSTFGCKERPPLVRPANLPPRPPAGTPMVPATPTPQNPSGDGFMPKPIIVKEETNWDEIGRQKNRSNLAAAVLQGKPLDWQQLQALEAWVLTGKIPSEINSDLDDIAANIPF